MAEGSSDSLVKDAIVSVLYDTSGPQVNVKGISQDLVRENVIDVSLEQRILSQQTDSDSQRVLAQHLHNFGILESIKRLCRVLRSTANRYHSHASVAEKLDKACGFSSLTAHSREKSGSHTPGELRNSEMSEEEIIEIFRGASSQLKEHYEMLVPVPPKSHRPTLDYIELAVINRGGEKMKNELQVKNFLDAALRGIDAIYKRLNSIKYVEILKVDKKCPTTGRRIVISGAPGCGKSTLSRQLCKDLSSRTLDNTYQLVILVELRELVYRMKEGEELGLKHLLMKYPYLSSKKVFNALLYDYGKNVLFILDGYDELDESLRSCQFLRDILSPSNPSLFLYKCDVVITTRPVTSGELFELVENPYRNVEILGFTEEHIHVYIDKYFENLENGRMKADKLKEKLEQLPHVRGMCRVPIVLEFVCKVHRLLGDQGIPDTQTGIYGTYVVTELFNSKPGPFNGKPPSQVSVQDLLIVSEEDFPGFSELCRKAFECCSSTKGQRLLLTEQDVSDLTQYLNRGSIYGLLFAETVESVCGSVRLFHYLHKSIQEMLAAVHIAKLPDEKHIPLWRDQFGRPEMAEIWKYYAGITELKKLDTNTLLDIFRKIREDQEIILMLSLYEANNQEVAKKVLPVMFSENKISITARSSYEIVAANYCIKHHPSLASFKLKLIGREIKFGKPLKDAACQISSHPTLKSLKCSGFKEKDWTLFSDGLVPCKSVSIFDIEDPTSAILGSIAKNSFDSPDSTLVCHYQLQDNTPVDEKELCEAWSQCKCKTVKIRLKADRYDHSDQLNSLTRPVLKGISVNGHVQHLVFDCLDSPIQLHGNHEEYHEWLSLLKQLLVPCLTCQLRLHLSPAEWAAILCGVGGAEQLEKLDVDMTFTDDNTPVDEKELCEAWSQCKCTTVKMLIDYDTYPAQRGLPLILSVLKGISVNGHVQHLVLSHKDLSELPHDDRKEYHDWMSLPEQLLVPRLTCQLVLRLSPAEWAAILCVVGGAEQLEELDVTMEFTDDNTPVDEKELCEAWSQCKCKTVKMRIGYRTNLTQRGASLARSVLKGISVNGHVQHLEFDCLNLSLKLHGNHEESHDWMSLLKQLLVLRLTCQLKLSLSPAEWAAILCGVGGAEQLEELDVTMRLTDDNTPVDEKELCEAWSQCKCKTVKMGIEYDTMSTQSGASLTFSVLKGISVNGHVQHLVFKDWNPLLPLHGNHEESHDWMSLLKQLLVPRLTCQLGLHLSPAEWAAILCGVGGAEQLEELDVDMEFTDDNTPVDEKELCEAWSQCKCKTVKIVIGYRTMSTQSGAYLARSVLKGLSVNGHVQHLVFFNWNPLLPLHGNHEESHDWMSSLRLLLFPLLTCQLTLHLSPAEWAAILCGVGGAEQLEKLDVEMRFTYDNTPVDEKELCEAWSQCKCKTVKMEIGYYFLVHETAKTPQGVSLLTGVLRGIAQNKISVEFKSIFWHRNDHSYYMKRIPGDILTHFTRDGQTLTLNPLNSRCPIGGVSSGESPQTPGSNPTGEPSNKRRHIEQPPLVGVTESTSSSPVQQVDHASRNVHSTQSDSSRSSPMSQRASLPQSPTSSVGAIVDPSSLVAVPMEISRPHMSPSSTCSLTRVHCMGDSPQPPSTCQRTQPIAPQYETGRSTYLSSPATSQDILPLMDINPMIFPTLHPPHDVQTLTGSLQRASSQYLSSSGGRQQSSSPPVPPVAQQMARTPYPLAQFSQPMYIPRRPWGPGPRHYSSQGPGMQQHIQNPQSVRHFQPSFHYSQSRPNLHGVEAPFSPPQVPGPHRPGMSQHIPFQTSQYRHTATQPIRYPRPPSHQSHERPPIYPYHPQGP